MIQFNERETHMQVRTKLAESEITLTVTKINLNKTGNKAFANAYPYIYYHDRSKQANMRQDAT